MVAKIARTVVFCVEISGPKVDTVTCGIPYNFAPLNQSIIETSWEIWHNSFLKNPILIRIVVLEGGLRELPQEEFSELGDPKL